MKKRILYLILAFAMLLSLVACTAKPAEEQTVPEETAAPTPTPTPEPVPEDDDDIIILFTNDVHCGIDENIGYAGLAAWKKEMQELSDYVVLVDCGDAIQGGLIGAISQGEYPIDIMNIVGYDYAIPGNHEFDYGMDRLADLIAKSDAQYLGCNVSYTGSGRNGLADLKPYDIREFGDTKVAFIGVLCADNIVQSTPAYFMENGEYVYSFGAENAEAFYANVQENIDACRAEGADYVIVLSHLGDNEDGNTYTSADLISNTSGINVVLDAHSHSLIPGSFVKDCTGKRVMLASTGTKLTHIGQLLIEKNGWMTLSLYSDYDEKDPETERRISTIVESYEADVKRVVAHSDIALSCKDEDGIRIVRSRETAIGDLCADAYRSISGADIAFVNGGGVRADLPEGDISYENIIAVHPFGNTLCMTEATGQEILDALEMMSRSTREITGENGNAVGENGGFLQVSGLKYTVDTSVASSVVLDENGMFVSVDGDRRVCNVQVIIDGEYADIEPEGVYTVASTNYLIKNSGDGCGIFADNPLLIDEGMSDYQILLTYITETLEGGLSEMYSDTEGRITVR